MRTPKIYALYCLIDWVNGRRGPQDVIIPKLPLSTVPIGSNAWFSGFIEADGHFSVRATVSSKKYSPIVECRLELVQRQIYHNGLSNHSFMEAIAIFLGCSLGEIVSNSRFLQYRVRTINMASNTILVSYLNKFPLFSSKHLNYLD